MLLDPDLLRSKADEFDSGLRGYQKNDVAAYLGRIALAVEVLGEESGLFGQMERGQGGEAALVPLCQRLGIAKELADGGIGE